jgi:hypothetical protein
MLIINEIEGLIYLPVFLIEKASCLMQYIHLIHILHLYSEEHHHWKQSISHLFYFQG